MGIRRADARVQDLVPADYAEREEDKTHEVDDGARADGLEVFDECARIAAVGCRGVDALGRVVVELLLGAGGAGSVTVEGVGEGCTRRGREGDGQLPSPDKTSRE